jgi:hypothetical protein
MRPIDQVLYGVEFDVYKEHDNLASVSVVLSSCSIQSNAKQAAFVNNLLNKLDMSIYEHNIYICDSALIPKSYLYTTSSVPMYLKYLIGCDELVIKQFYKRQSPGVLILYNCASYEGILKDMMSNSQYNNKMLVIIDEKNPPITLIPFIDKLYLIDNNEEQLHKNVYEKYPRLRTLCSFNDFYKMYTQYNGLFYSIETGEIMNI